MSNWIGKINVRGPEAFVIEAKTKDAPIWETKLPFEIAKGDGALIAKAMRAYRPDTSEEEGIVNFFIDEFAKLDEKE